MIAERGDQIVKTRSSGSFVAWCLKGGEDEKDQMAATT